MEDYKLILKMIREVDPEDRSTLGEIDARVWCWLNHKTLWEKRFHTFDDRPGTIPYWVCVDGDAIHYIPNYTRSRDFLKLIRPNPDRFRIKEYFVTDSGWDCTIDMWGNLQGKIVEFYAIDLPTEELAELDAIIQAIAYERAENETV